jgi:acetyl esterase/lipase
MTTASSHPPIDPELAVVLDARTPGQKASLSFGNIGVKRQEILGRLNPSDEELGHGGAVLLSERQVPGPEGAPDLTLLILSPARGQGPCPGVYYVHGGGMVLGDRRTGTQEMADWVADYGLVAVSVEYRLAPENPHPAPAEDCYTGLAWTAAHAAELGLDPARLMIAGTSAGGGLAAATALMARDRGGPALTHQVLMCPMLDDRQVTPSSQELDGEANWDRNSNRTGWAALLGDAAGGPDVSPYAAPARATGLAGLPPAFIDVGAVETFRDEDIDYAARLSRAGVPAELHVWPGATHGFDYTAPDAAISRIARATRRDYVRRAVSPAPLR